MHLPYNSILLQDICYAFKPVIGNRNINILELSIMFFFTCMTSFHSKQRTHYHTAIEVFFIIFHSFQDMIDNFQIASRALRSLSYENASTIARHIFNNSRFIRSRLITDQRHFPMHSAYILKRCSKFYSVIHIIHYTFIFSTITSIIFKFSLKNTLIYQ